MKYFFIVFALLFSFPVLAEEPTNTDDGPPPMKQGPGKKGPHQQPTEEEAKKMKTRDREFFPFPMEIQKWKLKGKLTERGFFAPSLVALKEGGYRMYGNAPGFDGVASYKTQDGITFTKEEGSRLTSSRKEGEKDCVVSHVWVVPTNDGYRMYYQANAVCSWKGDMPPDEKGKRTPPEFRIMSAFSKDGLTFEKEKGVRVDTNDKTNLTQAAHGRIIKLKDGTLRMFFSATLKNKKSFHDILGATSTDGLNWKLDAKPILNWGHDPTVIEKDGKIYLYAAYKMDMMVLESSDGYTFTPKAWVDFEGIDSTHVGDIEIFKTKEGKTYLYGHYKGSDGVGIFEETK